MEDNDIVEEEDSLEEGSLSRTELLMQASDQMPHSAVEQGRSPKPKLVLSPPSSNTHAQVISSKAKNDRDISNTKEDNSERFVPLLSTVAMLERRQRSSTLAKAFYHMKQSHLHSSYLVKTQSLEALLQEAKIQLEKCSVEKQELVIDFERNLSREKEASSEIATALSDRETQLEESKAEIRSLKDALSTTSMEQVHSRALLETIEKRVESFEKESERFKASESLWERRVQGKEVEIQELTQRCEAMKVSTESVKSELVYCKTRLIETDETIAFYKAQARNLQEANSVQEATIKAKDNEREQLIAQITSLHTQKVEFEKASSVAANAEAERMRIESESLKTSLLSVENERQELSAAKARMEQRLIKLQAAFEEISMNNETLQIENAGLKEQSTKDRKTLKELSRCVKKLQEIVSLKEGKECLSCKELSQERDKLLRDVRDMERDHSELQKKVDATRERDAERQRAMIEQLQRLENSMQSIEASKGQLETTIQIKEAMLKDQSAQISELKHRVGLYEAEITNRRLANEDLEERIQVMQEDFLVLVQQLQSKSLVEKKVKNIVREYLNQQIELTGSLASVVPPRVSAESDREYDRLTRSIEILLSEDHTSSNREELEGEENYEENALDAEDFLNVLDSIDGIALTRMHKRRESSSVKAFHTSAVAETLRLASNQECRSEQCRERASALRETIQTLTEKLHHQKADFERAYALKNEECLKISESLTRLELRSKELASIIEIDKQRYELSVDKYKADKKKLSKQLKAKEEELQEKLQELRKFKSTTEDLQAAISNIQKIAKPTSLADKT